MTPLRSVSSLRSQDSYTPFGRGRRFAPLDTWREYRYTVSLTLGLNPGVGFCWAVFKHANPHPTSICRESSTSLCSRRVLRPCVTSLASLVASYSFSSTFHPGSHHPSRNPYSQPFKCSQYSPHVRDFNSGLKMQALFSWEQCSVSNWRSLFCLISSVGREMNPGTECAFGIISSSSL